MERDNRKTGGRGRRSDMDPAEGGVDPGSREMVERKGAKAASADAEARYRSIFEHAVNGIFQTTPEGRFLSVNPALAAMYGFSSPSEMLAAISNIEEQYVEPDERTRLKSILERDGTVSKFETELYRKDGGKVWVSMSARAVKDGNGNVAYYEGFVENVTDRKAAEEALRKEKETFFTILNNDPVGVILSGRTGEWLYMNREFTNVTGYTREDLRTGRDWFRLAYPDREYRRKVVEVWRDNETSEKGEWIDVEFRIRCKDGQEKDIEFRSTFLKDYSITVLKDVTKRRQAERALHESEEKYRNIFENATEGIFQTTIDGGVLSANPAFARLFGYESAEEMLESVANVTYQIYADPERRTELKQILEDQGFVRNSEVQCRRKDGKVIWISVNMRVVRDGAGRILFYEGTLSDITERKNIQHDLENKSRSLEEANAALRALLKHREQDGRELEEKVVSNIKELVIPYVERLRASKAQDSQALVGIIETNLAEIMSPFIRHMASRYANFTPKEIQIADLIKKGKTTKEMSLLLGLSTRTIDIHRYNIRRKLNLNKKKLNLQSYLLTLS